MNVLPCTVADIEASPKFVALALEHAREHQVEGMPPSVPDWPSYQCLEQAGLLYSWSATLEGSVIGYISIVVSVHPRCGVPLATTEGWFVVKEHRKTGAGLKLFKLAEAKSLELTGRNPLVGAPMDSDLSRAMVGLGYHEISRVLFKPVAA